MLVRLGTHVCPNICPKTWRLFKKGQCVASSLNVAMKMFWYPSISQLFLTGENKFVLHTLTKSWTVIISSITWWKILWVNQVGTTSDGTGLLKSPVQGQTGSRSHLYLQCYLSGMHVCDFPDVLTCYVIICLLWSNSTVIMVANKQVIIIIIEAQSCLHWFWVQSSRQLLQTN